LAICETFKTDARRHSCTALALLTPASSAIINNAFSGNGRAMQVDDDKFDADDVGGEIKA
jgi:hypothetical protein